MKVTTAVTTTTAVTPTTPADGRGVGADRAASMKDAGSARTGPDSVRTGDQACREAVQTYLNRAADAPGESARSRLLAELIQQLCDAKLEFVEDRAPEADCFVRVRGKDRVILGQPGQAFGSAVLVFQDDLGRAGRADEARQQLRRYLACLWSMEPVGQRRNYLCLATDGFRMDVSSPLAPEPGRPIIVPGEIALKRLTLMDLRAVPPADLCAWLDRHLCRRRPLDATPANFLADFGPTSHAWQTAWPELTRLWSRLENRPDCQEALEAWRRTTAAAAPPDQAAHRFVLHTYLAMVARLVLWSRLNPVGAPGSVGTARTALAALDGSAGAALGIHGLIRWPLLWWTALPEAGDTAALVAVALTGLLTAYSQSEGQAEALDALCGGMCDAAYRRAVTTPGWLARMVMDRLLSQAPGASMVDPACGHGAFLRAAALCRRAGLAGCRASAALWGLVGLERDPLAASVAQVGLLLSACDLSARPPEALSVPVYWTGMTDPPAAAPPRRKDQHGAADAVLMVGGRGIRIPAAVAGDQALCRRSLQALWPLLLDCAGRAMHPTESSLGAHLWLHYPDLAREQHLRAALLALAGDLHISGLAARGEAGLLDALLALPLLFMRGRFQTAVARPRSGGRAWLAANNQDPSPPPDAVVGAAWELVREGGSLACVLPRAALGSRHYERLRGGVLPGARRGKGRGAQLGWWELWDLEEAAPPDGRPLCVFFGERLTPGGQPCGEAPGLLLSRGVPVGQGEPDADAEPALTSRPVRFTLARQRRGTAWSTEWAEQPPLELETMEGDCRSLVAPPGLPRPAGQGANRLP